MTLRSTFACVIASAIWHALVARDPAADFRSRDAFHLGASILQVETDALLQRIRLANDRSNELQSQLQDAQIALQREKERCQLADKELASTKSDAEGMMRVITQLERQVAESDQLDARARKMDSDAQAAVQSMTIERDQATAKEAQARR